jgi:hypothetical protein
MDQNTKKMVNSIFVFGSAALLGTSLLVVSGCGSDSNTAAGTVVTQTNSIPVGSVTAGTAAGTIAVTGSAPVTAATSTGTTVFSIPVGTTITPPVGSSFSATNPPVIKVATYTALSALPAPSAANSTFVLDSLSGAVDVQIGGLNGVSFSSPVTVSIPYTGSPSACNVLVNKGNGAGYVSVPGAVCSNGIATVQVSNLCTFVLNPHWSNGATGATGGSGLNGF